MNEANGGGEFWTIERSTQESLFNEYFVNCIGGEQGSCLSHGNAKLSLSTNRGGGELWSLIPYDDDDDDDDESLYLIVPQGGEKNTILLHNPYGQVRLGVEAEANLQNSLFLFSKQI